MSSQFLDFDTQQSEEYDPRPIGSCDLRELLFEWEYVTVKKIVKPKSKCLPWSFCIFNVI